MEGSLTRFLNHLPGMAYRCVVENYQYRLVFASKGCKKLLGITTKEVMRNPTNTVEKMMLEDDLVTVRDAIHMALVKKRKYELYYKVRTPLDEIKWIWDQGEGIFNKDGNCIFLEGIMMDVTVQKMTEQNLQRENMRLSSNVVKTSHTKNESGQKRQKDAFFGISQFFFILFRFHLPAQCV
jgi:hypothetical protein